MKLSRALNKEKGYIPEFDGIRGFFTILILIIHLHFSLIVVPFTLAYTGMHSFFIMSAFLISKSLLLEKKKSTYFGSYFKNYYIRRSLRIFPVYFAYILLIVIILAITYKTPLKQLLGITYELKNFGWMLCTFTYNFKDLLCLQTGKNFAASYAFPHLWSLSLEEQFYFVAPILVWFCNIKTLKRITVIVIIAFIIIRIIGFQWMIAHPNLALIDKTKQNFLISFILIRSTPFQFDTFFYGLFIVLFDFKNKQMMKIIFYSSIIIIIMTIIINGILITNITHQSFSEAIRQYTFIIYNGQYIYLDFMVNTFCVSMLYLCFKFDVKYAIFSNRFFVFVGKLSYGIYVYQYLIFVPCLYFFTKFMTNTFGLFFGELLTMITSISLIIGLSYLSYNTMEIYFINLKKNFLPKKQTS